MRYLDKRNRVLLGELVRSDFKLRYQGSIVGYAWSLLRPLLLFTILYIVFVKFAKFGEQLPYAGVTLLLGIVIWNFFHEMTTQSLGSIVGRGDLIRKIRIPRWIIILSSSFSALINLFLNLVIVAVFMVINGVHPTATIVLFPLILLEVYIFALGISLFLSAAYVKYRDAGYIWEVAIQAGFYITPILYPLALITNETVRKLILMNPVGQAIQDARYTLVSHDPRIITSYKAFDGGWLLLVPFVIVLVVFVIGLLYFKKEAKYFAENI